MKQVILLALSIVLAFALCACGGGSGFSMQSTDTTGAERHIVVGGDIEPSGQYTVVCKSGHGALIVNDNDMYMFAADEFAGKEYSGLTYAEEVTIELQGNDILLARNFNSSNFKLEFTYNG